ncbi:hypothetical protein C5167_041487 [Papaver somniferum]|nr:hypothetical protein C5167_041487 [Papaver somniferum]
MAYNAFEKGAATAMGRSIHVRSNMNNAWKNCYAPCLQSLLGVLLSTGLLSIVEFGAYPHPLQQFFAISAAAPTMLTLHQLVLL